MKTVINNIAKSLLLVPALVLGLSFVPAGVSAQGGACPTDITQGPSAGAQCAQGESQPNDLFAPDGLFRKITNILLFLIGAISVIMLIIGGIRYVVSGGDQAAITSAKNTILYAIIGIVVAFLAFAAVNFVTGQLQA